jgi:hypothetical protein
MYASFKIMILYSKKGFFFFLILEDYNIVILVKNLKKLRGTTASTYPPTASANGFHSCVEDTFDFKKKNIVFIH